MTEGPGKFSSKALTQENWADFVALLGGPKGGCGGCWCTWWRMPRSEWLSHTKDQRQSRMREIVEGGTPVGVLAYCDNAVMGWCAVAPHEDYPTMSRSNISRKVDDDLAWCVSCLFVKVGFRRNGYMSKLIAAGCEYAAENGARSVIGFPQVSRAGPAFIDRFVGTENSFRQAGFEVAERRGPNRMAMRKLVKRS